MKWLLVVILLAPAEAAQKDHSRVYETIFNNLEHCMTARDKVRDQFKVTEGVASAQKTWFDGSLANITCVPNPGQAPDVPFRGR